MHESHHIWLRSRLTRTILISGSLLCLICLAFFVWYTTIEVHPDSSLVTLRNTLTLQVTTGFDNAYRTDNWTPIHVTLSNNGPAFRGTLAVNAFADTLPGSPTNTASPWSFEQAVTLPAGIQKQMTIYAPYYLSYQTVQGFSATLRDQQGQIVTTQESPQGSEVKPGDLFVGILADPGTNFSALAKVQLPNEADTLTASLLEASSVPTAEAVLENFDIIVLDDFSTDTLSSAQIAALRTWVNRGGVLIEIGGPNWQRTLGALPADMLPVTMQGTTLIPAKTALLPINGPASASANQLSTDTLGLPLLVSSATLHRQATFSANEALLTAQHNPLIVQAHQGAGIVDYLAFDPLTAPFDNWSGASALWQNLLLHALGNTLLIPDITGSYDSGPGQLLTRGGILNLIRPDTPLIPWLLCALLLGYMLLLGPGRLFILRRLPRPHWWSWRIVISIILVFVLLSYGIAFYQKATSLIDNSIALVQLDQDGSTAHVTTYMGLFLPDQGNFNLHIPDEGLAQPIPTAFLNANSTSNTGTDVPSVINSTPDGTNLTLHSTNLWSLTPVITEQDSQLHGSLTTHLALQQNKLVGSISNTLHTSLSDVYILLPHSFVRIGHLAAQQTLQVNLPLHTTTADVGTTLSAQIAASAGLSSTYFPNTAQEQSETALQSHIALLSALSGIGFNYASCNGSCLTHAITDKGNIYVTGGQVPNPNLRNDYDPLLVSGAPATLIGWTDQPLTGQDNTTVNGLQPAGQHMSFIQMPLNLNFAGRLSVPLDFITGNVTDIQNSDAEAMLPGRLLADQQRCYI